mmetsp:Transcript_29931/g.70396  ORF Transcript_29931/g.70396 Transcript_29931/m.70396 type:complete len:299 (+) Transcript_29931:137-1033(+)
MDVLKELKAARARIGQLEALEASKAADKVAAGSKERSVSEALAGAKRQLKREEQASARLSEEVKDKERKMHELSEELKARDKAVAHLTRRLSDVEETQRARTRGRDETGALQRRVEVLEAEVEERIGVAKQMGAELEDKRAECLDYRGRLHAMERDLSDARQQMSRAKSRDPLDPLEEELRRARRKNKTLSVENETLRAECDALRRSARSSSSSPRRDDSHALRKQVDQLRRENADLRQELDAFDPGFFEEVEDLKYTHREMVDLNNRYETLLREKAEQHGFEFEPERIRAQVARQLR